MSCRTSAKRGVKRWLLPALALALVISTGSLSCQPDAGDSSPPDTVPQEPTAPEPSTPVPPVPDGELPPDTSPQEPQTLLVDWTADGVLTDDEYLGEMVYDDYEVRWRSDDQYVYIGQRARAAGYVALGIQPGSRMKDADMIIGFLDDGQAVVWDCFSTGTFGPHSPDVELGGNDDILDYGGGEADGYLTIEFQRRLDTGDELDIPLVPGANTIIWAYGNSALPAKHTARGYGEITIANSR